MKPYKLLLTSLLTAVALSASAQGTAFTYQGWLNASGSPASGTYNLTFTLFNTNTSGVPIAGPVTNSAVGITNGLFTVLIDFGPGVFTGTTNWLEIAVETNGGSAFTTLTPRQQLTPVPYAISAESASGLSGTLSASQLTSIGNNNGGSDNFFVGQSGNSTSSGNANTANGFYALLNNTSGSYNTANGFQALYSNTNGYNNTANGNSALYNNTSGVANTANGNSALYNNTSGSYNTANGSQALYANKSGINNTANGFDALSSNTSGNDNTANGFGALQNNTSGNYNTANGFYALAENTSGWYNTANGGWALAANTNGINNVANGYQALYANTSGSWNTANGYEALYNNTSGGYNTANGASALYSNTNGSFNTANGLGALYSNTSGNCNTASGYAALVANMSGSFNTASGYGALSSNTNGSGNTANGYDALYANTNGNFNTAAGLFALYSNTSGSNNIALGYLAGYNISTGSSNIDIGNVGLATDTNIIRIGSGQSQTFLAGVINGNGGGLTNLNASQLAGGTIPLAQLPAAVVTNGQAGNVTLNGSLILPATATAADTIYSGSSILLRADNNNNFFAGVGAGNLTMTGTGDNVGVGDGALQNNTTGYANAANGFQALNANTNGSYNTANGAFAMFWNTSGSNNTANGYAALAANTTGIFNTANGSAALYWNTIGWGNTANGYAAIACNTKGGNNTANGYNALFSNTSGTVNTANGTFALLSNTNGYSNTADGYNALYSNTSGSYNIALGSEAGYNLTTGSNNICIGNQGVAGDNGVIRIGTSGTHTTTLLTGNVGIGTTSPGEVLEVDGADVTMRLRNTGDSIGAFVGDTCSSLQLGMYNPTASTSGVIPPNTKRSFFGLSNSGLVGSISSVYECPTFRNLLDDGNGRLSVGVASPTHLIDVTGGAYCNGTSWVNGSDRNAKEAFTAINPRTVLEKVSALPITEWKYKAEADGSKHLGPMAQDFHAAFGLNGADDKHIATVDEEGVALAAIQGLNQKLNEKDAEIQAQARQIEKLVQRLEALEQRLSK